MNGIEGERSIHVGKRQSDEDAGDCDAVIDRRNRDAVSVNSVEEDPLANVCDVRWEDAQGAAHGHVHEEGLRATVVNLRVLTGVLAVVLAEPNAILKQFVETVANSDASAATCQID